MEGALFVKKMNIELIDTETKTYSKNSFFYCEDYIRKIEKSNAPMEILSDAYSLCYKNYLENRFNVFRENKNSQNFILKVMKDIKELPFSKLGEFLPPNILEKVGFIHTLANDEEKDVKRGEKNVK